MNGSKSRKTTTLKFTLGRNAVVEFTVRQVWPVCRTAGTFRVRGHAGANRVRFDSRLRGARLGPGTYRITAHARGTGRVLRVTIVIVDARAPSETEFALARRSNACRSAGVLGASSTRGALASAATSGGESKGNSESTIVRQQRESGEQLTSAAPEDEDSARPVASDAISTVAEATKEPAVIALLALAVLMLGLAAVPRAVVPDPRVMALVASHRAELATAGTAALAAAVVAMLLV